MNICCVAILAKTILTAPRLPIFALVDWVNLSQRFNKPISCEGTKKDNVFSLKHTDQPEFRAGALRPTLDDDAASITSVPSIRAAPLLARLTVKAADSFPTRTSHQFNTALVHKVPGLLAKPIKRQPFSKHQDYCMLEDF